MKILKEIVITKAYPQLKKLKAVHGQSQAIGEFLEWLGTKGILLATYEQDYLYPIRKNTETLLAEYFKINLKKLEQEKRAILEQVRAAY